MDTDTLTKAWINIDNEIKMLRRNHEEIEAKLKADRDKIGAVLLGFLNVHQQEASRTVHGTFRRAITVKPSHIDWEKFYGWIREENAFDALQQRVKISFLESYLEATKELPPGVSVNREYVLRVTRPRNSGDSASDTEE